MEETQLLRDKNDVLNPFSESPAGDFENDKKFGGGEIPIALFVKNNITSVTESYYYLDDPSNLEELPACMPAGTKGMPSVQAYEQ